MRVLPRRVLITSAHLAVSALLICLLNLGIVTWHVATISPSQTRLYGGPLHHKDRGLERFPKRWAATAANSSLVPRYHEEPKPRPPLESIVQGWNITGDPSWLLNFAIVGFPKCGTSTLMFHLQNHPEIQIFGDERCEMSFNQQVRLINDLYHKFPSGDYTRGIKCPMDLESTKLSMRNYNKFFPNTDFIVGIRHPVLWFESFYNHRIQNEFRMPPAEQLIGKCRRGYYNVCSFRSNFHIFLGNLGKTNMTSDPNEYEYVAPQFRRSMDPIEPLEGDSKQRRRVFLYEVSQLSDSADDRNVQFRVELQHFLGLQQPISPMIWFKPGRNHTDQTKVEQTISQKMDICSDRYQELRRVLMEQAVNASRWIRMYFVKSKDVVVSSKDYFVNELMSSWERDPCLDRKAKTTDQQVPNTEPA